MVSEEMRRVVIKALCDRGEAINKAFHFPASAYICAEMLEKDFEVGSDEAARSYVEYVQREIEKLRTMKFLGEK